MANKKASKTSKYLKFKQGEAIVFEPSWWDKEFEKKYGEKHPLKNGELVYYLCEIPNVQGHCIVIKYDGKSVPMVHPQDFRKATEEDL